MIALLQCHISLESIMAPTIRIDEQVYRWLQGNARPFEDTPNSVLRRIAGLDTASQDASTNGDIPAAEGANVSRQAGQVSAKPRRTQIGRGRLGMDGKQLNDEWKVGARHALFSRDGKWFQNLEQFPGALFDPHGYLLFKTEREYRNTPHVHVGKKTNVRGGIASLPGYVRKA